MYVPINVCMYRCICALGDTSLMVPWPLQECLSCLDGIIKLASQGITGVNVKADVQKPMNTHGFLVSNDPEMVDCSHLS